jgi:predicted small secreted protein
MKGNNMIKLIASLVLVTVVSACSTTAGMVRGIGEDVKAGTDTVGNWIKPVQQGH